MRRAKTLLLLLALAAAACGGATAGDDPTPTPTPEPTTGSPKSESQLKLAVLDALDDPLDYCDPDAYPVAKGQPIDNARERFPQIEQDREAFEAILEHEGLSEDDEFTDEQLIAINELYKQMQAVQLESDGDLHRFSVQVLRDQQDSLLVTGTVDAGGAVTVEGEAPTEPPNCPICLSSGTLISTPHGMVAVAELRVGDRVWSLDRQGRRILARVLAVGRAQAPLGHEVVRVRLADGRTVTASPGHPLAGGRTIGSIGVGDRVAGTRVASVARVAYTMGFTHDIRVSGPTGLYLADGIALRSTIDA